MTMDEIKAWIQIAASSTTVLAFLGIAFKPIRTRVSKWLAELFTADIKAEMVMQVGSIRSEMIKDRELQTSRHVINTRRLKRIEGRVTKIEEATR